ncbi:MAG: hypothetical protein RBR67_20810 [Desulfobacterium sp.]|jgi:hypothetical protein|nr:hypothetical protein [Desulfobacterium sp.]
MEVIRQIVEKKSITSVFIPEEFGDQVEIIVLPIKKIQKMSDASRAMLEMQEKIGFTTQVLQDASEDVWNEL